MRRLGKLALTVVALSVIVALPASAQTASPISLQISGLWSIPFSGGLSGVSPGPGVEAQLRWNPSLFGIGFGAEFSTHDVTGTDRAVQLTGAFFEPRYVIVAGSSVAIYLAGRVAISQTTFEVANLTATATGFTANGGGGFLFVLGSSVSLDLGASFGAKGLGEATIATAGGDSVFDLGSGQNVIIRVGLAIGL